MCIDSHKSSILAPGHAMQVHCSGSVMFPGKRSVQNPLLDYQLVMDFYWTADTEKLGHQCKQRLPLRFF